MAPLNPASTGAALPKARTSTRTIHDQNQPMDDDACRSNDEEDPEYASTGSSSSLSDAPSSLPSFSELKAAQPHVMTRGRPKKVFIIPRKSPLVQQEEDEAKAKAKAARDASKKQTDNKPTASKTLKPQKTENCEQEAEVRLNAKVEAKAKRMAEAKVKRDNERTEKEREIEALKARGLQKPAPWKLQLPALLPRENTSGHNFSLKLIENDDTLPLTHGMREDFVSILMDAIRDSRYAQDMIAITTKFWHTWLKLGVEGRYPYEEIDMERVCRKLVNIAKALHTHGLGATDIYCKRTIEKARAAAPMKFRERIEKTAKLMRTSKARCNDFMISNTLEDTIALIDLKLADQKSNAANNHMRSVKVKETNNRLGIRMGQKWPKDADGKPIPYAELSTTVFATPESMSPEDMEDKQDELAEERAVHPEEHFQQSYIDESDHVQYPGGFQDEAFTPPVHQPLGFQLQSLSPFRYEGFDIPPPAASGFGDSGFGGLQGRGRKFEMHYGHSQQSLAALQPPAAILPPQMEPPRSFFGNQASAYGASGGSNPGSYGPQIPVAPVSAPNAVNHFPEFDPYLPDVYMEPVFGSHHSSSVHVPDQYHPPMSYGQEAAGIFRPRTPLRGYRTFGRVADAETHGRTPEADGKEGDKNLELTAERSRLETRHPEDFYRAES
ncbi:hypothetical protein N0V86_009580 [Didymella sp. IMI 355093]|nr:hypothetical protein N0V86_009580 [Didymella sp. IMI 355093]